MEKDHITRNVIIISIIAIVLSIGVGFSFAFFTANIKGNSNAKDNIVKAGKMEITYIDGESIKLEKMQPKDTLTKTFSVKNTGDFSAKYNIKLDSVTNTLVDKKDLRYTLKKGSEEIKKGTVPGGSAYLVTDIPLESQITDEYTLTIEFKDTGNNQNDNQGKSYSGKIQIDTKEDVMLATNPEVTLYQGLIPIDFDGAGNVITADTNDTWYDYTVQEWANAVLVDSSNYEKYNNTKNKIIPMEDILQMYVYIPRYKYQLFNVNNEGVPKQIINIEFENGIDNTGDIKCEYINNGDGTIEENCINKTTQVPAQNGEWYTHPAFTFGSTELPGIWVGKFEPSEKDKGTEGTINKYNEEIKNITILPNKVSIVYRKLSPMYAATQSITTDSQYNLNSSEVNTHIMKNIEWGAVAYLSQSQYGIYNADGKTCTIDGCVVYRNNTAHGPSTNNWDGTITGCSALNANDVGVYNRTTCEGGRTWEKEGVKASTTGNIYGIYDMAGGMWEYVMGNMVNTDGAFYSRLSGFTDKTPGIDTKYYDIYSYDDSKTTRYRGHLGDATREVLDINNQSYWNNNYADFVAVPSSWFIRSGLADSLSGIFASSRNTGEGLGGVSFRVVLTAQDGNK